MLAKNVTSEREKNGYEVQRMREQERWRENNLLKAVHIGDLLNGPFQMVAARRMAPLVLS
jgi:hypothetical protein